MIMDLNPYSVETAADDLVALRRDTDMAQAARLHVRAISDGLASEAGVGRNAPRASIGRRRLWTHPVLVLAGWLRHPRTQV